MWYSSHKRPRLLIYCAFRLPHTYCTLYLKLMMYYLLATCPRGLVWHSDGVRNVPFRQMQEVKCRDSKWPAQGHTTTVWWNCKLHSSLTQPRVHERPSELQLKSQNILPFLTVWRQLATTDIMITFSNQNAEASHNRRGRQSLVFTVQPGDLRNVKSIKKKIIVLSCVESKRWKMTCLSNPSPAFGEQGNSVYLSVAEKGGLVPE